jgi:hypothetical protein
MALLQFTHLNKYNNLRTRIIYSPTTQLSINPYDFGEFVSVKVFKYEYTHPIYPPTLFVSNGKKYIVPTWQEVDMQTEVSDINWVKPVVKQVKPEVDTWKFKSSSSDSEYIVRKTGNVYKCNCPGYWRSKDRECKHIKEVKNY